MSTQLIQPPLLHPGGRGTTRWILATRHGRTIAAGAVRCEIVIDTNCDDTERFRRRTDRGEIASRLVRIDAQTLLEQFGPLALLFDRTDTDSGTNLTLRRARVFGQQVPTPLLDITARVLRRPNGHTTESTVAVTLARRITFTYTTQLATGPTETETP